MKIHERPGNAPSPSFLGAPAASRPSSAGWAMSSFVGSIRRVMLITAAAWQLVMLLVTWGVLGLTAPLALVQVLLGLVALASLRYRLPDLVLPVGMTCAGLWGYIASGDIDSTLAFAANWQINFATCVAGLVILRRWMVLLVLAESAILLGAVRLALPEWGWYTPVAIAVTQTSIILVIHLTLPRVTRLAAEIDAATVAAEEDLRQARIAREAGMRIAEDARVLHDTAINTLGAIANGGFGTADTGQVREQCARDVAHLRALSGESLPRTRPVTAGLREVFDLPGIPIRRSGLDDDEIERLALRLPEPVTAAIAGCAREAVLNAAKHSGADHVDLELRVADESLIVTVRDAGVGFAGEAPAGRGIDASIRGRARDFGFAAEVLSRPGAGTTVALTVPLRRTAVSQDLLPEDESDASIVSLHRRAALWWSIGSLTVSVLLTAIDGTRLHGALYAMIAVMVLACVPGLVPWPRRSVPWIAALLIAGTCAVFFLSAAATGFGSSYPLRWQALAQTGPFVLLLSLRPGRRTLLTGAAIWALLVAGLSIAALPESARAAQITAIAGLIGLGFSCVWAAFQRIDGRLGRQALRSRRRAFAARLRLDLETAAQSSYLRGLDAGIDSAVGLLDEIAEGRRDPRSEATRAACGEEERYMRQLVQIGPDLVHLGREVTPTLRYARDRGVRFMLRLGSTDAPDPQTARGIAAVLLDALAETEPEQSLSATLFPVEGGLQLTIAAPRLSDPASAGSVGNAVSCRLERLGTIDLLELRYRLPGAGIPDSAASSEHEHRGT